MLKIHTACTIKYYRAMQYLKKNICIIVRLTSEDSGPPPLPPPPAATARTTGTVLSNNINFNLMNVFNDIYLEREKFEDRELLEKLKYLNCSVKCLLQTIEDQTHSNRLFFTGLVKKLSKNYLVNATPKLLDLQRSQFRSSALASLNEFRALKIWRKLLSFLI